MSSNYVKAFISIASFFLGSVFGQDCPTMLKTPDEVKAMGEIRLKAIKGWDKLLSWTLSPKNSPYPLKEPLEQTTFHVNGEEFFNYDENYGYFSIHRPIVGIVTKNDRDIQVTQCLLTAVANEVSDPNQLLFSTAEVLTKVMAYRSLKKGMKIAFAAYEGKLVSYTVDEEIDLWRGMPAFGLIPDKEKKVPPLLLFRGTDLNFTSEKGWASILSDLDTNGPGYVTFLRAQKHIHSWLKKMHDQGMPAVVSGFSLGGVFAIYSLIYEHDLLNKQFPSTVFNPPGISSENLDKWQALKEEERPPHIIYINEGDFVSQVGFFPSNVWEASLNDPMKVIQAHVTLVSAQPSYKLTAVDVNKLNKQRR